MVVQVLQPQARERCKRNLFAIDSTETAWNFCLPYSALAAVTWWLHRPGEGTCQPNIKEGMLVCSGQDSSCQARESQRGGKPCVTNGAARTNHREGVLPLPCILALLRTVQKRLSLCSLHIAASSSYKQSVLCKWCRILGSSILRILRIMCPWHGSRLEWPALAGVRGALDWSVGTDWAAGCKQGTDKSHNAAAKDCMGR